MRDFRTIVGMALVAAATAFPAGAGADHCTYVDVNGAGDEVCYDPYYTGPLTCLSGGVEPLDAQVCVPQPGSR